jgi:hypothetical protein
MMVKNQGSIKPVTILQIVEDDSGRAWPDRGAQRAVSRAAACGGRL